MPDGIDKSLLDRLQALRGAGTSNNNSIKFDVIERARTPTGGDLLAARLKSLRAQAFDSPPRSAQSTPTKTEAANLTSPCPTKSIAESPSADSLDQGYDEDALLETSDQALEEMLAADMDISPQAATQLKDDDDDDDDDDDIKAGEGEGEAEADIKALLDQLSASVPTDTHSDDSDGQAMTRETEALIAQYRQDESPTSPPATSTAQTPAVEFPSAPETESSTSSTDMADLTARMAALRRHSADPRDLLPSVPTAQPSKPVQRLTSKTGYTDDDMDSWCTVCLEDATLRCTGCDGDVYCTRCWREMHVGPAAHFDDRSHKALQFTRDKGKTEEGTIALGA
ncbi:hypothetical protein E4U41_001221 [Claviceps citrina]|nr:hypothetical protein E4U41_001221 [Claviceps citrina]